LRVFATVSKYIALNTSPGPSILQNGFNLAAKEIAGALKAIGFAAGEVGKALHDVFNVAAKELAQILKSVGFAAEEVGKVLHDAGRCLLRSAIHPRWSRRRDASFLLMTPIYRFGASLTASLERAAS